MTKKMLKRGIVKNGKRNGYMKDEDLISEFEIDTKDKHLKDKIGELLKNNVKVKEITKDAKKDDIFSIPIDIDDKLGGCSISGDTYNHYNKDDTRGLSIINMASSQLVRQIEETFKND